MKKTKEITNEEYNGIPFILPDIITRHVNQEEKKWYSNEIITAPKVTEHVIVRDSKWWIMFFKQVLP